VLVNSLRFVSTKAKSPFHAVVGVIEQCGFISTGCLPDPTTAELRNPSSIWGKVTPSSCRWGE
jgi:hypothetical protein